MPISATTILRVARSNFKGCHACSCFEVAAPKSSGSRTPMSWDALIARADHGRFLTYEPIPSARAALASAQRVLPGSAKSVYRLAGRLDAVDARVEGPAAYAYARALQPHPHVVASEPCSHAAASCPQKLGAAHCFSGGDEEPGGRDGDSAADA